MPRPFSQGGKGKSKGKGGKAEQQRTGARGRGAQIDALKWHPRRQRRVPPPAPAPPVTSPTLPRPQGS
eukprot:4841428-Prymnesium_polylepis.1